MATGRGTRQSLAAWGLAGVPILATFVQTTLSLLETTLGSAGLSGLQDAIRSIAVFDAAAILMWQSPTVLSLLFLLIGAAWVTQGVAQFRRGNRDVTFAAAGLVSVLFFTLFFGVYSAIFGMSVPMVQVVAFFAVPVLASGAALGSAFGYDWDEEVVEEKSAELATLESDLEHKRESFEDAFRQRIGNLDPLTDVAPTGVERARERHRKFQTECEDIESDVASARGKPPEQLRAETATLRSRVEDLDPEAEVERVDEDLRERLVSGVRTTYGTVNVWSRYNQSYELVNLPSRFREVEISAFDVSVHVDRLDDTLVDRIEHGSSLQTIAEGVAEVAAHVERVEEYVGEREAEFANTVERVDSDVEAVTSKVEQFDGTVRERLTELVVEGRHDDLPSVNGIQDRLAAGKDALHDCRFDDAERAADDAAERADELVTLVEFLWSVVGTIDHGGERVSLPTGFNSSAVGELRPAFENEYDVEIELTSDDLVLAYPNATAVGEESAGSAVTGSSGNTGTGTTSGATAGRTDTAGATGETSGTDRTERARPEEIIDEILFVLRELKLADESTNTDGAELQTDNLPENVATPAVLTQLEQFGQRQTDVVERIEVQENAPPGFLELVPKDGVAVSRAVDALHERYREKHR